MGMFLIQETASLHVWSDNSLGKFKIHNATEPSKSVTLFQLNLMSPAHYAVTFFNIYTLIKQYRQQEF